MFCGNLAVSIALAGSFYIGSHLEYRDVEEIAKEPANVPKVSSRTAE